MKTSWWLPPGNGSFLEDSWVILIGIIQSHHSELTYLLTTDVWWISDEFRETYSGSAESFCWLIQRGEIGQMAFVPRRHLQWWLLTHCWHANRQHLHIPVISIIFMGNQGERLILWSVADQWTQAVLTSKSVTALCTLESIKPVVNLKAIWVKK